MQLYEYIAGVNKVKCEESCIEFLNIIFEKLKKL